MPHDSVVGSVDGRTVGKAIAASVRPLLRRAGFTEFTQRKAWRPTERHRCCRQLPLVQLLPRRWNRLDDPFVLRRRGAALPRRLPRAGASRNPTRGPGSPRGLGDHVRWQLHKGIQQPLFHPYGRAEASDRPDVWFVPADGEGLEVIVEDATRAFAADGLPVLDFLADPENAFTALVTNIPLEGLPFRRPHDWSRPGPPSEVWFSTARAIGSLSRR